MGTDSEEERKTVPHWTGQTNVNILAGKLQGVRSTEWTGGSSKLGIVSGDGSVYFNDK